MQRCSSREIVLKSCTKKIQEIFFSIWVFFHVYSRFTGHQGAGGYLFKSSLPLPPTSQTLRHQPGNYCRELTSVHSWQPESSREPLVSECKSLIITLRALEGILSQVKSFVFKLVYKRSPPKQFPREFYQIFNSSSFKETSILYISKYIQDLKELFHFFKVDEPMIRWRNKSPRIRWRSPYLLTTLPTTLSHVGRVAINFSQHK